MIISEEDYLAHYGILRKSGRFPWGSGNDQSTRNRTFLDITNKMRSEGMSDVDVAKGFGMTTTELRAVRSIAGNQQKEEKSMAVNKLRASGNGASAIAAQLGINESSVRSILAQSTKEKNDNLQTIASMLKSNVDDKKYVDIGAGVENRLGITDTKLRTAVAILKEKGYVVHPVQTPQVSGPNKTTVKVLAVPGTSYRDVVANMDKIRQVGNHSDDNGRTFVGTKPPLNINSKRVDVRYKEQGGADADGVIYVRRGVTDVNIGGSAYAQVRIAVDGTHYLKGMAVYKDDLPAGVDLQFNTNKSNTGNKLDAMKKQQLGLDGKVDQVNPFGSQISRQILDDTGTRTKSAMNLVNEEGSWGNWSNSISTQVLSKQKPQLAEEQLKVTRERMRKDLDEIKALTNPAVRRKLLESYADGADSSAVHLAAAALPRQGTHVILPISSLKTTEVYAPNYRDGELVALVRYPHGGKFEIPELVVNNRNREAKQTLGARARDAIAIHPKVAERLSGADFDGDTVVVFPNNGRKITSEPALQSLKGFDPQQPRYKLPDSVPVMSSRTKGTQMGLVSNLITDMTIKGATNDELARAVKHSMVVIDAEKHHLNYKLSAVDNGIKALYTKYASTSQGGSSTLISRATSQTKVDETAPRRAKDGGPINVKTGALERVPKTFVNRDGVTTSKQIKVDKLSATTDARTLISDSNTKIERVYAEHSNKLKAMANEARIEVAAFKPPRINPSAKLAYKDEVDSLKVALNIARRNKPLERQAQLFANAIVQQKLDAEPGMDPANLKKIKVQALATSRARTGALKSKIAPTPKQWEAIQAGAISQNQLKQILDNADLDVIRTLATPRTLSIMTTVKAQRAQNMAALGYTQSEIADQLGVSVSTLKTVID